MTKFEAFVGFRKLEEISECLDLYPEFQNVCTKEIASKFISTVASTDASISEKKAALRLLFNGLQTCSQEILMENIQNLISRIKSSQNSQDLIIKRLNDQYENDVGIFCALMLNYVVLEPGQSIFLAANEPHAYLSGDCIECLIIIDK